MREFATRDLAVVSESDTTTHAPARRAAQSPGHVMVRRRGLAGWSDVTAGEFHAATLRLARGLVAAGLQPGDRVALLSKTRYEWTLLDYAIWYAAAVSVPVYPTASGEQLSCIVRNSSPVAAFAETAQDLARLRSAGVPADRVWTIDDGRLDRLAERGSEVADEEIASRMAGQRASDPATIVYTSGTTGAMKGCTLTHRNLLAVARNTIASIPEIFSQSGTSTVLCLPLAHSFTRFIQVTAIESGTALGHVPDPASAVAELSAFRPTFLPAVPRMLQKIHDMAVRIAAAEGREEAFRKASEVAVDYSRALSGGEVDATLKAKHAMMDELIYGRLRETVGGARFAVSGAAPLGEWLAHFYRGIGITVLEGYGLTETTAPVAANVPSQVRPGTVGRPVPGCTLRVADDGEVFVRGPSVFSGYWEDEEATKEVFTEGGWLRTGDLGSLDADGFLTITGRSKNIIVTASGKNVAPEPLEERIMAHPLVGHCVVVGEGRPFVACLVTLDDEATRSWLSRQGGAPGGAMRADPAVIAEVERAVNEANATVSEAEAIKKVLILGSDLSEASGHLTPSLKVRRAAVVRDFAAELDELYGG